MNTKVISMNTILLGIGIGLAASISSSSVVVAHELQEVVVTGKGVVAVKPVEGAAGSIPIVDMSISYGVSYEGLDLASAVGAAELEKRVNDAATKACKEIAAQYPLREFTTSEAECAKTAADKAMVKARALIAEARSKPVK